MKKHRYLFIFSCLLGISNAMEKSDDSLSGEEQAKSPSLQESKFNQGALHTEDLQIKKRTISTEDSEDGKENEALSGERWLITVLKQAYSKDSLSRDELRKKLAIIDEQILQQTSIKNAFIRVLKHSKKSIKTHLKPENLMGNEGYMDLLRRIYQKPPQRQEVHK